MSAATSAEELPTYASSFADPASGCIRGRPRSKGCICVPVPPRQVLECTAFVNPDGAAVVVVMNRSDQPIHFDLRLGGLTYPTGLPPHSIASYLGAAAPHAVPAALPVPGTGQCQ